MRNIFRKLLKRFEEWKVKQEAKYAAKYAVPKYLRGDKSKHRVHTTKYEDLCKEFLWG